MPAFGTSERIAADIGRRTVEKLRVGVITAAARVWNEIFLHEHATLGGTADDLWSLELELTFDIFIRTLYVMPKGKAVGQSGFSVELLLVFPRGGTEQRVF